MKSSIILLVYNYIKQNIIYIVNILIIDDKKGYFELFKCKQFNNDITGYKMINYNNNLYGTIIYIFNTETAYTLNIINNHSIKNIFLNKFLR